MPPHWMFAFDDFLKTTIKHSIEFLTPELRSDDSVDGETTPNSLHPSTSLLNSSLSVTEIDCASISKYRKVCVIMSPIALFFSATVTAAPDKSVFLFSNRKQA